MKLVLSVTPLYGNRFFNSIHSMIQKTLIVGREVLKRHLRDEPFDSVQCASIEGDAGQHEAEVVWFEDGNRRKCIKDRNGYSFGQVLIILENVKSGGAPR